MESLRLVSLNIDGRKNFDRILPFLAEEKPDVACLQEICETDLERIKSLFPRCLYVPMTRVKGEKVREQLSIGFAVFFGASVRPHTTDVKYYVGKEGQVRNLDPRNVDTRRTTEKRAVAICRIMKGGTDFRIATTHFTWVPDGRPGKYQRGDAEKLLDIIAGCGELVLCGDFNAPRGGTIFRMFADHLKDNVPPECTTSIDPDLHRIRGLRAMVDGMFSTPAYSISDVKMTFGLSDHAALSGKVTKD